MGRRVIEAADGPGFLVNRCGRPFSLEALSGSCEERIADPRAGRPHLPARRRLPHGPVRAARTSSGSTCGFDVAKIVLRAVASASRAGDRPSSMARMVAAGQPRPQDRARLSTDYGDGPHRPEDPEPPAPGGGDGHGRDRVAGRAAGRAAARGAPAAAGWQVRERRPTDATRRSTAAPAGCSCAREPLRALDPATAVGFHALPPLAESAARRADAQGRARPTPPRDRAERFLRHARLPHRPGSATRRASCSAGSSASSSTRRRSRWPQGVGAPDDVDAGMTLGLSHPRGPVAWARRDRPRPRAGGARRPGAPLPRGALPRRTAAAPARRRSPCGLAPELKRPAVPADNASNRSSGQESQCR